MIQNRLFQASVGITILGILALLFAFRSSSSTVTPNESTSPHTTTTSFEASDTNMAVAVQGKPSTVHPRTETKTAEERVPNKAKLNQTTIQGVVLDDWFPLAGVFPQKNFVASRSVLEFAPDRGIHIRAKPDAGYVTVTNQQVLFGDFRFKVNVIFGATIGRRQRGPTFGLRALGAGWAMEIASPEFVPFESSHTLEIVRRVDEVHFLVDTQLIAIQNLKSKTQHAGGPQELAKACQFFIEASKTADIWITGVQLSRPSDAPNGLALKNRYRIPTDALPSDFNENRAVPGEKVFKIPAGIADVVTGANGRYLVIRAANIPRLLIFDLYSSLIVGQVNLDDGFVSYTAGAEKLILLIGEGQRMEQWNISPLQREKTFEFDGESAVEAVLGPASREPTMLHTVTDAGNHELRFFDHELNPVETTSHANNSVIELSDASRLRVSPEGRTFTITTNTRGYRIDFQPSQYIVTTYRTRQTIIPGPVGQRIYGLNNDEFPRFDGAADRLVVPSVHGPYCVEVRNLQGRTATQPGPTKVRIYARGFHIPLVELDNVDFTLAGRDINQATATTFAEDDRIHLIPNAKMLVTVPRTNDRIVLRQLDVRELLSKSEYDYFFIASGPMPRVVVQGTTLTHQLAIDSRFGALTYQLRQGPSEMRLSSSGLLTWPLMIDEPIGRRDAYYEIKDNVGRIHKYHHELYVIAKPSRLNRTKFRVWTDVATNRTAEARFVRRTNEAVILERRDGKHFTVAIVRLSEADCRYIDSAVNISQ